MKFNCFFLMPFLDDFPAYLRDELEKLYVDGAAELFDITEARMALQQQRQELVAECEANSKLQRRFDLINSQLRNSKRNAPFPSRKDVGDTSDNDNGPSDEFFDFGSDSGDDSNDDGAGGRSAGSGSSSAAGMSFDGEDLRESSRTVSGGSASSIDPQDNKYSSYTKSTQKASSPYMSPTSLGANNDAQAGPVGNPNPTGRSQSRLNAQGTRKPNSNNIYASQPQQRGGRLGLSTQDAAPMKARKSSAATSNSAANGIKPKTGADRDSSRNNLEFIDLVPILNFNYYTS